MSDIRSLFNILTRFFPSKIESTDDSDYRLVSQDELDAFYHTLNDWTSKIDKNGTPYIIQLTFPKQPRNGLALNPVTLEVIFDDISIHQIQHYNQSGISKYSFTLKRTAAEDIEGGSVNSSPQNYDDAKELFLQAIMTRIPTSEAKILMREIKKHNQEFSQHPAPNGNDLN